jgi:ribonucleoside-diphosphate reductase alpha chain
MEIAPEEWQAPGFNLLRKLGFTRSRSTKPIDVICGRGTVEGAPHLREEHLAVFDCANKCGKIGKRFIHVDGHIRMMAAAQPFISGAISKTINLPNEATVEDIKQSYELSWKLGLKANALYRDGSKLSQPLNVKSDADLDEKTDEEDAEAVESAREEVARDVARAALAVAASEPETRTPDPDSNIEPVHTHIIEKIVERIVERPLRRRLPDTRNAITHKFDIAGHEGYITAGLYEDGSPGEVFITMAKEGSTIGGLMDAIATLTSVALQYGVPGRIAGAQVRARALRTGRHDPQLRHPHGQEPGRLHLPLAGDGIRAGYRAANAPKRSKKSDPTPERPTDEAAHAEPKSGNGNGHNRLKPDAKPIDYTMEATTPSPLQADSQGESKTGAASIAPAASRLGLLADPLSQQGTDMQSDAPACDVCGSITVRSGTCYKCLNCGNSMGCS